MLERVASLCLVVLAVTVPAAAQDKPFTVTLGVALVGPLSDSADRFSTGIGFTAGRVFAELRYHDAWGPTFATPAGSVHATGKFLPLTVGVTF